MEYGMNDVNEDLPVGTARGWTLRSSTNNNGSDLSDLIAVPVPVPTLTITVVCRRGGESRGYCLKPRCNTRKARRGFAFEAPVTNEYSVPSYNI